jgi:hypothetical protein
MKLNLKLVNISKQEKLSFSPILIRNDMNFCGLKMAKMSARRKGRSESDNAKPLIIIHAQNEKVLRK